jgi:hypothetical protein
MLRKTKSCIDIGKSCLTKEVDLLSLDEKEREEEKKPCPFIRVVFAKHKHEKAWVEIKRLPEQ